MGDKHRRRLLADPPCLANGLTPCYSCRSCRVARITAVAVATLREAYRRHRAGETSSITTALGSQSGSRA